MQIFEKIQQIIEDYYLLPAGSIQLKTRKREIVQARQMCHFFGMQETDAILLSVGSFFGGVGHATVLHSIKTIKNLCIVDAQIKTDFDEIARRIFFAKDDHTERIKEKAESILFLISRITKDWSAFQCVKELAISQVSAIIASNPTTNTGESTVFFWMEVKKYIETNY